MRISRKPRFVRADEAEFRLKRHAAWLQRLGKTSEHRGRPQRPLLLAGPERIYGRKSVLKASFVPNFKHGQWRTGLMQAHARYLERDGHDKDHKEFGFDAASDHVDIALTARNWALAKDWRHWRMILSPEDHERVNLPEHTRQVMGRMEHDLGTRLQWVAVQHSNTDHQHVHVFLRGVREQIDEKTGKCRPLAIPRDYVSHGIREISEKLIEQELGPRSEREYLASRGRGVEALYWTPIDRTLYRKADIGVVDYSHAKWLTHEGAKARTQQEMERLAFLQGLGLAKKLADTCWELRPDWKDELRRMQLEGDVVKSRTRVHALRREQGQLEQQLS